MPLAEPGWWYDGDESIIASMLSPVGWAYGRITSRRMQRRDGHRSRLPVVCVGNFTVGGTGKTPLSIHIAELVRSAGGSPAFLTRGYKGSAKAPHWVDSQVDTAALVGDEPLLLARTAPTLVCRDRRQGIRAIEKYDGDTAASIAIMDDGLQNPSLAKDLTIAVVDGARGFGNGRVFPAGPLRAPLDEQFKCVDAIVVNMTTAANDTSAIVDSLRREFPGPVMTATLQPAGSTEWLVDMPVFAFAGIGNPSRFFATLERLGADVRKTKAFPDHHTFVEDDARSLMEEAERLGATLVTTEKDYVRLTASTEALDALRKATRQLPVQMLLEQRDAGRLAALLDMTMRKE